MGAGGGGSAPISQATFGCTIRFGSFQFPVDSPCPNVCAGTNRILHPGSDEAANQLVLGRDLCCAESVPVRSFDPMLVEAEPRRV